MDDTVSLEGACMCAAELLYVGAGGEGARDRGTRSSSSLFAPLLLFRRQRLTSDWVNLG